MKLRSITILALIPMALLLQGCLHWEAPLRGYYYEGKLPSSVIADLVSVTEFANDLSAETGLVIADKSTSNVFLISNGNDSAKFNVNVSFYTPKNTFYIAVRGDIESPAALAATQKASELFEKKYRGSKLTWQTVYPGLLGP
jgi:hypothetical protein